MYLFVLNKCLKKTEILCLCFRGNDQKIFLYIHIYNYTIHLSKNNYSRFWGLRIDNFFKGIKL